MSSHIEIVVDQFTRQATPFSTAVAMRNEEALRLLVEFSRVNADDTVLDVACGPGLVVAAFAKVCQAAVGIDLTPAMIDKAKEHAVSVKVSNVEWHVGDVTTLPFSDGAFSTVVSRFAFHHFVDPLAVFSEMKRVAARRVVVADIVASEDGARGEALNRMEKLRDPSHTRALSLTQLRSLFAEVALPVPRVSYYEVRVDLEGLLAASFPAEGDIPIIRKMFIDSLADNGLGMNTQIKNDKILLSYPVAILAAEF